MDDEMLNQSIPIQGNGFLLVRTRSANRGYPLGNTQVEVYLRNDTGKQELYLHMTTDGGGSTPRVLMPITASAENGTQAYPALVRVHRHGYFSMEARDVPIFDGVTSLQEFEMIPFPEGAQFSEEEKRILIVSAIYESPPAPSPSVYAKDQIRNVIQGTSNQETR